MSYKEESGMFSNLLRTLPEPPDTGERDDQDLDNSYQRRLMETKLRIAENRSRGLDDNNSGYPGPSHLLPSFDEAFSGQLPCPLFYLDKHSVKLRQFKTFDELSEFILTSEKDPFHGRHFDSRMLSRVCAHSVQEIVHFATLGEYLKHLYEADELMDVKIDVDGEIFHAHRLALCCFSGYFSDLLLNKDQHRTIPVEVKLLGIGAKAFATFLEFVYTGTFSIHPDTAADMLIISEFLDVKELKHRLDAITDNLPLSQAVKIVVKCRGPSNQLHEVLIGQILRHFSDAAMVSGFLDMDVDTFCRVLASDHLHVGREYDVFQVALRWVVHGGHGRLQHVTRVFKLVRFCHMTVPELVRCVQDTHLFFNHQELRDLILVANWILTCASVGHNDPFKFPVLPRRIGYITKRMPLNLQVERGTFRSPMPSPKPSTPTASPRFAKPVMIPQGNATTHAQSPLPSPKVGSNTIEMFPEESFTHVQKSPLPSPPWLSPLPDHSLDASHARVQASPVPSPLAKKRPPPLVIPDVEAYHMPKSTLMSPRSAKPVMVPPEAAKAPVSSGKIMKVDIYVIGGFMQGRKNTDSDDIGSSVNHGGQAWMKFCNLPSPRCHHTSVLVGGKIYLLGGYNPTRAKRPLHSLHRMNPSEQIWIKMADMLDARMNHGACAINDKIYVFGGIGSKNEILSTAECYDTVLDVWNYIAMMSVPRFASSVATLGNVCYVTGGMTSDSEFEPDVELDLVECYHPGSNSWSMKAPLRQPRCYATMVNVQQTLYLCGGAIYSNTLNGLLSNASIDEYNPNTDTWCHVTDMTIPRHAAGVAVAGRRIYIIGGISSPAEQVLRSVECYDTADSRWLPDVDALPHPARWLNCVSVPQTPNPRQ